MNVDQLRHIATQIEAGDSFYIDDAADYLRACASAMEAGPVAWGLKMPAGDIRLIHTNLPASINAQNRWPDAYNEATHIPLYPLALPAPQPVSVADELPQSFGNPEQLAIPHGWKLVPVEPTPDMVEDGANTISDNGGNARWSDVREAWDNMLAAAPTPPIAAETVEREHDPLHLSRILHELAGAASLCWEPRPSGVFDSQQAIEFVEAAIAEIRSHMPALRLPEPMTDEEIERLWTEAPGIMGALRAIEAETLRRVKEANNG